MGHLELQFASSTATPQRIAELVASLGSDTVTAKPLSEQLWRRLQEIAELHGGEVHLHGRLFAQWMHHVYPSECPFPHAEASPSTPDQLAGSEPEEATEEERRRLVEETCGPEEAAAQWSTELPWSEKEELLSTGAHAAVHTGRRGSKFGYVQLMVAG